MQRLTRTFCTTLNLHCTIASILMLLGLGISNSAIADKSGSTNRAHAELHSVNGSGVSGKIKIRADGSVLQVKGRVKGLDPNVFYVSLFYDILSVSTGAWACEPGFDNGGDPFLGATMDAPGRITVLEMGFDVITFTPLMPWQTDGGRGKMNGSVEVGLDRVRTISVRDTSVNGGMGPEAVVACGLIVPNNGG